MICGGIVGTLLGYNVHKAGIKSITQMVNAIDRLTDVDRERARGRIQLGLILARLGKTALGLDSMKSCELTASKILLDKALPSLANLSIQTDPNLSSIPSLSTPDLMMLLAALELSETGIESVPVLSHNGVGITDSGGYPAEVESVDGGVVFSSNAAGIIRESTNSESIPVVTSLHDELGVLNSVLKDEKPERASYSGETGHNLQHSEGGKQGNATIGVSNDSKEAIQPGEKTTLRTKSNNSEAVGRGTAVSQSDVEQTPGSQSSPEAEDAREHVTPEDALALINARIAEMESEYGYADRTSDGDGSRDEAGGTGRSTGIVKGGYIPATGIGRSGKLR